ncbi:UNVERIFIED_CONTAM: hypothetical protein HDU68_009390 [Siphonaria sp. JEL0065]|nr:hypothetical protein HDU68_009390 [Siphonaria sp. JEL0065]
MCPVAGEFDDLLKDLDASLDEIKTGVNNTPKTVSDVLQSAGAVSGLMNVIPPNHPNPLHNIDALPWVQRFMVLTIDSIYMFVSPDPHEPALDQFKITHQTEAIPSLGYLPGNPMAFEVADPFYQKSWILKASSKTAKDTWIEMIQTITPTAPKPEENELLDYLEDYAGNNQIPVSHRQQDLQAFKDHQRFRGVPINIARVHSVSRDTPSSTGSPVQTLFSPMSPQQFNWERRDSESTSFDEHRASKWSASSGASGERYPAYPFESQPVGIPGGGIFGSAPDPAPDMARSRSNTGNKSPSSSYGADVKRKKSTSKAQMSKAFIQY